MSSSQAPPQGAGEEMPLPPKFESISSLLDMSNDRLEKQPFVSVIGIVKDFQPPVATRGPDWKCSLSLVDLSTQFDFVDKPMKLSIFMHQDKMPRITGVADVVLVRNAKVQMRGGHIGLLSNLSTEFHVFPAKSIPTWSHHPTRALPKSNSTKGQTTVTEVSYVVWLHNHIDQSAFPTVEEFESRSNAARNIREKYSPLKDLKADNFYDLIGEVIKVYENDGRMTMYLTDYTTNPLFYKYTWGGDTMVSDPLNDEDYNYIKSQPKATKDWPGPFGKRTLQLTLYDDHAAFVREQVKASNWVLLKNVHVKMGNQGGCIEGFLRRDRGANENKFQVQIIQQPDDPDLIDPRWKDAVRWKKQYLDEFKEQERKILENPENGGQKRKATEESSKQNSKKRRKERRIAMVQKVALREEKIAEILDLNMNVECNRPKTSPTPLSEILYDKTMLKLSNGTEISAPFVNAKYRVNVRVVDFWPPNLKDFSVGRRVSEFEVLSDFTGGEDTDPGEDMRLFRAGKGYGGEKKWEWRFGLEVECVSQKAGTFSERMWLVVGNDSAQMLLNMDASDLRQDPESLGAVRETLFRLWGDLEEKKSAFLERQEKRRLSLTAASEQALRKPAAVNSKRTDDLPPDSDEENLPKLIATKSRSCAMPLSEKSPNALTNENEVLDEKFSTIKITNRAFRCCIQQYGVKVPEDSAWKANAGNGMRWQQRFGLFGTRIMI